MKILQVHNWQRGGGGEGIIFEATIRILRERGHRVSIILTLLFIVVWILWLGNRKLLVVALLLFSLGGTVYLCMDANIDLLRDAYGEAKKDVHITRTDERTVPEWYREI